MTGRYPDPDPYDRDVTVRELGKLVECVHAPVYFAPQPQQNYAALGLRGYWRGYFASRAAALGTPAADTVTELFGGFAPSFVARAIPEVWTITAPEAVLRARLDGAVAALRSVFDGDATTAARSAAETVDAADYTGRPLAAAHAALPRPDEPLAALWHGCTVLRELRGDAHLQALREFELPWPRPHLLATMTGRLDPQQRDFRGWSEEEWRAAEDALRDAGCRTPEDADELSEQIELRTDALTADALGSTDVDQLAEMVRPVALRAVDLIPFPNAVGLRRPF